MSWTAEFHMGELRPWPSVVLVKRGNTDETKAYTLARTAKKVKVPRKDHLRIGHVECSECGTPIGYDNRYCHHCGARLEDE